MIDYAKLKPGDILKPSKAGRELFGDRQISMIIVLKHVCVDYTNLTKSESQYVLNIPKNRIEKFYLQNVERFWDLMKI